MGIMELYICLLISPQSIPLVSFFLPQFSLQLQWVRREERISTALISMLLRIACKRNKGGPKSFPFYVCQFIPHTYFSCVIEHRLLWLEILPLHLCYFSLIFVSFFLLSEQLLKTSTLKKNGIIKFPIFSSFSKLSEATQVYDYMPICFIYN